MDIFVNDKLFVHEGGKNLDISQLLSKLEIPSDGVAIAVNKTIVYRTEWNRYLLASGDKLVVIRATSGG